LPENPERKIEAPTKKRTIVFSCRFTVCLNLLLLLNKTYQRFVIHDPTMMRLADQISKCHNVLGSDVLCICQVLFERL
jgi:hypothetical protein